MIYFIRHAQSKYNAAEKQIQTRNGQNYLDCQEYLAAKFDSRFFDVEITERGVEQSLAARKEVAELDVDIILVSPLRRALQTCSVIFEGHKSKAQIVVEPAFREIMESSNDIGTEVDESMSKFPTFDFSHIKDKQAWYVHTLHDESDRKDILSKLQGKEGHARKQKCIELCLSFMKQNWSARRSQPQKEEFYKQKILPSYPIQKQIIMEYLKKYQKIAIVAHSECIKRYAGYKINNCQVFKVQGSSI